MAEKEDIGLMLENAEENKIKTNAACIFDEGGGFIGSGAECILCVQDKEKNINEKHIRINFEEGFFTITPVDESKVFYNESFSPMQGGYENIINKGDTFKIGLLKFRFVESKEISKELLEGKERLEVVSKQDDNIDEVHLRPRGKVKIDFNEKQSVKELIESKPNYDFIEIKDSPEPLKIEVNSLDFTRENIDELLNKALKQLQQNQKKVHLNDDYTDLNIKDLEQIIANIPLIKSAKLINLIALSLINKELYSPIFEEMQDNAFLTYLKAAIQGDMNEQKHSLENLTIRALLSYREK